MEMCKNPKNGFKKSPKWQLLSKKSQDAECCGTSSVRVLPLNRFLKTITTMVLISEKKKVFTFHPMHDRANFFKIPKISGFYTNIDRFCGVSPPKKSLRFHQNYQDRFKTSKIFSKAFCEKKYQVGNKVPKISN